MSIRKCVINHARGGWYPAGQKRLVESFKAQDYDGDFLLTSHESEVGSPTHQEVPYAFKAHMLKKVMDDGYDYAIWCDSAVYLVGPIERLYERLETVGYVLVLNGWDTGTWCRDAALEPLGIGREESFLIPHLMANMMAFDLRRPVCQDFVKQYYAKATDGVTFKGPWHNRDKQASQDERVLGHRHDQTAASVISWQLGMRNWSKCWTSYIPNCQNPNIVFETHPAKVD